MNIDNIAIVRATNIIPFDGVINPISEVPYLVKPNGMQISFMISDLLTEQGILESYDFTKINDEEYQTKRKEILDSYLPYISSYNSVVLFSLNGLVPDDMNNMFSNKNCVIVDGLKEHISDVVSLMPTDTAIKGKVLISSSGVLHIKEDFYNSLSDFDKSRLSNLNFTVKIINGSLEDAVKETLTNSDRFHYEKLSLTRSAGGFFPSETSEDTKRVINEVAISYDIPQVLYYDLLTKNNAAMGRLSSVASEYDNSLTVTNYYLENFYNYLLSNMGCSALKSFVPDYIDSIEFIKSLTVAIRNYGLENYKKLVDLSIDGITSFTTSPLRISTYLAIPTFLALFIYFIYVIIKCIRLSVAVQAYQAIILLVLFFSGVQILLFGIIGEYLGRIFNASKNRPLYLVNEYNGKREENE